MLHRHAIYYCSRFKRDPICKIENCRYTLWVRYRWVSSRKTIIIPTLCIRYWPVKPRHLVASSFKRNVKSHCSLFVCSALCKYYTITAVLWRSIITFVNRALHRTLWRKLQWTYQSLTVSVYFTTFCFFFIIKLCCFSFFRCDVTVK